MVSNQFELPGEEQAHGTRVCSGDNRRNVQKLQAATHDQIAPNERWTNTSDSLIAAKSKENFAFAAKQTAQHSINLQRQDLEVGISACDKRTATSCIESVMYSADKRARVDLLVSVLVKQQARMISEELSNCR